MWRKVQVLAEKRCSRLFFFLNCPRSHTLENQHNDKHKQMGHGVLLSVGLVYSFKELIIFGEMISTFRAVFFAQKMKNFILTCMNTVINTNVCYQDHNEVPMFERLVKSLTHIGALWKTMAYPLFRRDPCPAVKRTMNCWLMDLYSNKPSCWS